MTSLLSLPALPASRFPHVSRDQRVQERERERTFVWSPGRAREAAHRVGRNVGQTYLHTSKAVQCSSRSLSLLHQASKPFLLPSLILAASLNRTIIVPTINTSARPTIDRAISTYPQSFSEPFQGVLSQGEIHACKFEPLELSLPSITTTTHVFPTMKFNHLLIKRPLSLSLSLSISLLVY